MYFVVENIRSLVGKKTPRQIKAEQIRGAVMQDIREYKDVSIAEVSERLEGNLSTKVVRKYMVELLADGYIRQSGKGRWTRFILNE